MYRIYLDVCCLNRPFDDQTQARIRLESEAVLLILNRLHSKEWVWLGSDVVQFETHQNPDSERRSRIQLLASNAHEIITLSSKEIERGKIMSL